MIEILLILGINLVVIPGIMLGLWLFNLIIKDASIRVWRRQHGNCFWWASSFYESYIQRANPLIPCSPKK